MPRSLNSYYSQKLTGYERYQRGMLMSDMYRQDFRFVLPDRQFQYRSLVGSCLSIFTVITIISYCSFKLHSLVTFGDFEVQTRDQESYFDQVDEFGATNDHFMIAAAVSSFDGMADDITDPKIGKVKFYLKSWGGGFNSMSDGLFKEIPSHLCPSSVFNNDASDEDDKETKAGNFYPTNDASLTNSLIYGPKLRCAQNIDDL